MFILFFACTVGEKSLNSSREKQILTVLEEMEHHATQVEDAATELESYIDQARRNIQNGASPEKQKKELEYRIQTLKERGEVLYQQSEHLKKAIQIQATPLSNAVDESEREDN